MIKVVDDSGEEVLDIKERIKLLERAYADLKHYYTEVREALIDVEDLTFCSQNVESLEDLEHRLDEIEYVVARKLRRSPSTEELFAMEEQ